MVLRESLHISDIPQVYKSPGIKFNSLDDVDNHVDLPLRPACKVFFSLGIRTVWSSANKADPEACLLIDTTTLSSENMAIARRLKNEGLMRELGYPDVSTPEAAAGKLEIAMVVKGDTSVEAVRDYFEKIAKQFKLQPATWR